MVFLGFSLEQATQGILHFQHIQINATVIVTVTITTAENVLPLIPVGIEHVSRITSPHLYKKSQCISFLI